jgi:crotonobetainyl-CoA:carnitine CoA-transferase CaiB-like acyl-CoA transferase
MLEDERFKDVATRLQNLEALANELRDWARSIQTAQEIEDVMAEAGLAMGVVRTMGELADTDWAEDRNVIIDADDRYGSTFRVPNAPWVFSGSDVSTRGIPKFRGEDNAEVLQQLAGVTPEEVEQLTASGVLSIRLPKK